MKRVLSVFLILLLTALSVMPVHGGVVSLVNQTLVIPIYVGDGAGGFEPSGSSVTFRNNFAAPIEVITPYDEFRVSSLPQVLNFDINILPSDEPHDFNFTVTSSQVTVQRLSPVAFRTTISAVNNIAIDVNPAGGGDIGGGGTPVTVTTSAVPANGGSVLPATGQHNS